jgi:succinate dehydrogenase / fumarate reductase iron-sulfur subunit
MKFRIFRTENAEGQHRYDTFDIPVVPGMTVLSALFHIQERYDESLAFRFSCRGAVCGACAMLINGIPRLACRTQIQALQDERAEMVIEPLPHLPVMKDLIVDMDPFFQKIKEVDPVFHPGDPNPEKERLVEQTAVRELEKYTNCILCGACYAACPNEEKNPGFLGPAALAKLYRFFIDPRESPGKGRLIHADNPGGWWGCEFHSRCRSVCPKGVTPDIAIGRARKELKRPSSPE